MMSSNDAAAPSSSRHSPARDTGRVQSIRACVPAEASAARALGQGLVAQVSAGVPIVSMELPRVPAAAVAAFIAGILEALKPAGPTAAKRFLATLQAASDQGMVTDPADQWQSSVMKPLGLGTGALTLRRGPDGTGNAVRTRPARDAPAQMTTVLAQLLRRGWHRRTRPVQVEGLSLDALLRAILTALERTHSTPDTLEQHLLAIEPPGDITAQLTNGDHLDARSLAGLVRSYGEDNLEEFLGSRRP